MNLNVSRLSRQAQRTPGAVIVRAACCCPAGISIHTKPYIVDSRGAHFYESPDRTAAAINALFRHASAHEASERGQEVRLAA